MPPRWMCLALEPPPWRRGHVAERPGSHACVRPIMAGTGVVAMTPPGDRNHAQRGRCVAQGHSPGWHSAGVANWSPTPGTPASAPKPPRVRGSGVAAMADVPQHRDAGAHRMCPTPQDMPEPMGRAQAPGDMSGACGDMLEPHGMCQSPIGPAQDPWDVIEPTGTCWSPQGRDRSPWDVPKPHGMHLGPQGRPRVPRPRPAVPGQTHLIVLAEVAVQLVEVGGALGGHRGRVTPRSPIAGPTVCPPLPAHLAGVPGAALRDVALVHRLPAGHATRLVLRRGRNRRVRSRWRGHLGSSMPAPDSRDTGSGVPLAPTLQPLQQSPSLHMASWVSVHFLQQLPPLLAHSCRDSGRCDPASRLARPRDGPGTAPARPPGPAHRQRAAVALLARLHEAVAALRRVQELPGPRGKEARAAGESQPSCCHQPPEKGHRTPGAWQDHPSRPPVITHKGPALSPLRTLGLMAVP